MRAKEFIIDGIGGQFISGLTGGQTSSLGGLAKLGAANVAGGLGFNQTAANIRSTVDPAADMSKVPNELKNMSTKELADALGYRVGNTDFFGSQRVKIKAINSEGVEGVDLQSHLPVTYPKEALAMELYRKQQQGQQGQHE